MVSNVLPAALLKLVDHFPGAAVLKQGELFYVNQAVEELTGLAREDLSSEPKWRNILSMADQDRLFRRPSSNHAVPPAGLDLQVSLRSPKGKTLQIAIQIHQHALAEIWFLQTFSPTKQAFAETTTQLLADKTEELAYAVNLLLERHHRIKQIRHRDLLFQQALELHSQLLHSLVQLVVQRHQHTLISLAESMSKLAQLMDESTEPDSLEQQIQMLESLLRYAKKE